VIDSFWKKQPYFTGFEPRTFIRSLQNLPVYWKDWRRYQRLSGSGPFRLNLRDAFPVLTDMSSNAGTSTGHYFHQDLWAAKKIFRDRPAHHYDIGSRTDGFIAHLLVFMPVTVIDIRPLESDIEGLTFFKDDASQLANFRDNSVTSLSSLHVAEHFGLGRYTDPIDPAACFKFMASLQRVLSPKGKLYFSVPVGRERVEFNAHRVFAPKTILTAFSELELLSFSYVGDDDRLHENVHPLDMPQSEMACGLFEFTK
jgi:hypothetical protein